MAGLYPNPNDQKMQQEMMRHNALKGIKNSAPDSKRDKKFFFGVIAAFLLIGVVAAIFYFGAM